MRRLSLTGFVCIAAMLCAAPKVPSGQKPKSKPKAAIQATGLDVLDEPEVGKVMPPKQAWAEAKLHRADAEPAVSAESAIIIDRRTRAVIWAKNPKVQHFPASTTKVMTGYLLATLTQPSDVITAPLDTKKTTGSSLHLAPGEQVSSQDLLFALMLRSANDGCHAVALKLGGSEAGFAEIMNKTANEMGCTNTHFANPHGLPNKEHWTTAFDLARIASYALDNPRFAQAVKTKVHVLKRSGTSKDIKMVNRDKALALDPTTIGVKTGFTNDAGKCFVGAVTRPPGTIITVVMKSKDWLADHLRLTEWAYAHLERVPLVAKGDVRAQIPIEGAAKPEYPAAAGAAASYLADRDQPQKSTTQVDLKPGLAAPLAAGTVVGTLTFEVAETKIAVPLVLTSDVTKASPVSRAATPVGLSLLVLLGGGAYYLRRKSYVPPTPPSRRR